MITVTAAAESATRPDFFEEAMPLLAHRLGRIHGGVGGGEKLLVDMVMLVGEGDADRQTGANRVRADLARLARQSAKALDEAFDVGDGKAAGQEQRELVAAKAGDYRLYIGHGDTFAKRRQLARHEGRDGKPHTVGNGAKQLVAGMVAKAVVDQLELVDVEEQKGARRAGADRLQQKLLAPPLEGRGVNQAGQRVMLRIPFQTSDGRADRRDQPLDRVADIAERRAFQVQRIVIVEVAANGAVECRNQLAAVRLHIPAGPHRPNRQRTAADQREQGRGQCQPAST